MRLENFNYHLPKSLIAQKPISPRDRSRLLLIEKRKNRLEHRRFREILKILQPGDILVLNNSKVIPARLLGKKQSGGKAEILLLRETKNGGWKALIKNLKDKNGLNQKIAVGKNLTAQLIKNLGSGIWEIKFDLKEQELKKILRKIGKIPTPPYIKRPAKFKEYQTVFAKHPGSVAAPTAGFHFTRRLLHDLKNKGVEILFVTLHVGLGTFQPIKTADIKKHKMHSEIAEILPETARRINAAKKEKRRIIAVGTTVCRTLESFADNRGLVKSGKKEVDLFILPGYKFKIIDGLITNFHLPKTTLLLLVAAFLGKRLLRRAYREAIKRKYRFYSFGDAMMII